MSWEILRKYVEGTCSEQELEKLGEWIRENQANEDFFTTFIEHWEEEKSDNFEADAQAAWEQFKKSYKFPSASSLSGNTYLLKKRHSTRIISTAKRRGGLYWYYSAAAALVVIVTLVLVTRYSIGVTEQNKEDKLLSAQEITTPKGQRTNLKLSDGSHVVLNSESRLLIPKSYGEPSRTLYLEGEAFFRVEHDEDHPFVVITPRGFVKDLGTEFNVKVYGAERLEVAVKEGLASIGEVKDGEPQKELVELSPNKLGVLTREEGLTVSQIKNMNVFTGWIEGKLVFNETPLPDVIRRLERWYDIKGVIQDSQLAERTLSAVYDNMPLNEVLKVLSVSMHLSYEKEGNTVTFLNKQIPIEELMNQ